MRSTGPKARVGLIGAGTIAKAIAQALREKGVGEIDYLLVRDREKASAAIPGVEVLTDATAAISRQVDLVVEAATPDAVKELAPRFLERTNFCAFSLTALAEPAFEQTVADLCARFGRRFFAPHGAVLALDGLADGRDALDSVTVTTTKSAKSFGLSDDVEGLAFEGSAREACRRFPRNVNVHAAVAIAGIGFDLTQSRIVVEANSAKMRHEIEVRGAGLTWNIAVASQSLGGVSGSYTPSSAAGTVIRLIGSTHGITIA